MSNDVIASFSSTGTEVDIVAPGVAVRAPVPTGSCALCDPSGYKVLNGTSMATPHVSGVAALLMSRGFTAAQAWNAMTSTAQDLGAHGLRHRLWSRPRQRDTAAVDSPPIRPPPPPPPPPTDTVPPSVVITSPFFFQRVQPNTLVTIRASASDNVGVTARRVLRRSRRQVCRHDGAVHLQLGGAAWPRALLLDRSVRVRRGRKLRRHPRQSSTRR